MATRTVYWKDVDKAHRDLATDFQHDLLVQREAIPIIFVPGVMGSRLRRTGTNGTGTTNWIPNLRWDSDKPYVLNHYLCVSPAIRKRMLIGRGLRFDPNYLEVDNDSPPANGFRGVIGDYLSFLEKLRDHEWGALSKVFVFPVYAFGYNWTASNRTSGAKLAARITEIIAECKKIACECQKVILVAHSMGGLVARSAMKLSGAEGKVLGVVHGVHPAYGAPVAYMRMKSGIEGKSITDQIMSNCLGPTGRDVTALLANSIGGLQLLPGKHYKTIKGSSQWLALPEEPAGSTFLPNVDDPFNDIYRVPAVTTPVAGPNAPLKNAYWGLVDPELLTPEVVSPGTKPGPTDSDALSMRVRSAAWDAYLDNLAEAEAFLTQLGTYRHPATCWFSGKGVATADEARYAFNTAPKEANTYPARAFHAHVRDLGTFEQSASLLNAVGSGDGTVPVTSSSFNGSLAPGPGPKSTHTFDQLEHQPAYDDENVQAWTFAAITALAGIHLKARG